MIRAFLGYGSDQRQAWYHLLFILIYQLARREKKTDLGQGKFWIRNFVHIIITKLERHSETYIYKYEYETSWAYSAPLIHDVTYSEYIYIVYLSFSVILMDKPIQYAKKLCALLG